MPYINGYNGQVGDVVQVVDVDFYGDILTPMSILTVERIVRVNLDGSAELVVVPWKNGVPSTGNRLDRFRLLHRADGVPLVYALDKPKMRVIR